MRRAPEAQPNERDALTRQIKSHCSRQNARQSQFSLAAGLGFAGSQTDSRWRMLYHGFWEKENDTVRHLLLCVLLADDTARVILENCRSIPSRRYPRWMALS